MDYAKILSTGRIIPLEITGGGKPFKELSEQTDSIGNDVFFLYSRNKFDNPFQKADEALYQFRYNLAMRDLSGLSAWAEIFPETVESREMEMGETSPAEGFVPITYRVLPGTPLEIIVRDWLPKSGFYLPVEDSENGYRFFKQRTLIPEKTVSFVERAKAEEAFRTFGLPLKQMSGFVRLNDYRDDRRYYVSRIFNPDASLGRFYVDAEALPSHLGLYGVASRPAKPFDPEKDRIIMEA